MDFRRPEVRLPRLTDQRKSRAQAAEPGAERAAAPPDAATARPASRCSTAQTKRGHRTLPRVCCSLGYTTLCGRWEEATAHKAVPRPQQALADSRSPAEPSERRPRSGTGLQRLLTETGAESTLRACSAGRSRSALSLQLRLLGLGTVARPVPREGQRPRKRQEPQPGAAWRAGESSPRALPGIRPRVTSAAESSHRRCRIAK